MENILTYLFLFASWHFNCDVWQRRLR